MLTAVFSRATPAAAALFWALAAPCAGIALFTLTAFFSRPAPGTERVSRVAPHIVYFSNSVTVQHAESFLISTPEGRGCAVMLRADSFIVDFICRIFRPASLQAFCRRKARCSSSVFGQQSRLPVFSRKVGDRFQRAVIFYSCESNS